MLERVWRKGTLLHCWWECKLIQSLWKTVWRVLKKLGIKLPFVVVVQLLSHIQLFETPWTAARLPCPSPSPGACSNSSPLSWWCHPTISSSLIPFSSCLQSFPASGSFLMSALNNRWPKYWSFRINPSNEYSGLNYFRINWFDLLVVK